jgi:dimethylhistidine N-methyltransferase
MLDRDVLDGLRAPRKHLPCRLLWDARGAELFARICTLEDYYPTRHELALLAEHLPAIARAIGPRARVIEPGAGVAHKTRMLLDALAAPASYVPIDVEAEQLAVAADALRAAYPGLDVEPVRGDYLRALELPPPRGAHGRAVVFFPGSTIGNLDRDDARAFLARFGAYAGDGALLVLGADSNADVDALVRAYDDREGVTAEFDRNVLAHVNRAYGGDFDLSAFDHRAVWNAAQHRIEMQLVSARDHRVRIGGEEVTFARGEAIVTEHCHKYPPELVRAIVESAGWRVRDCYADARGWMRLWIAER